MVFSSITFLFYFLPIVILAYFIVPYKNTVLLISSLVFYSFGEPRYIFLMLITVFVNYLCALLMANNRKNSKLYLIIAITFSLLMLLVFKYTDFIIITSNNLFNINIKLLNIALPIGISFYTFQILSYTIDVYRREVRVQGNYFTLLTYVSLFPQLIAGPIVRYSDVYSDLIGRRNSYNNIYAGIKRFIIGLSKKVIIANTLAVVTDGFKTYDNPAILMYYLYTFGFSLQLYFDFSGYSDMAIGLGKIFGFNFLENFNYPFIATSITDFWRRWHISLGSFFRDYLYIPLGGSRVPLKRYFFNILVVWTLTGLWHGAAFNFILWGLFFAILLLFEKIIKLDVNKRTIFRSFYVVILVVLSFVIFDSNSLKEIVQNFKNLFFVSDNIFIDQVSMFYLKHYAFVFIIAIIGATPLVRNFYNFLLTTKLAKYELLIETSLIIIGFFICTIMIVDANFNPFLYFRF